MSDDLFNVIVSRGVLLARPTPESEWWMGTCPFGDHPELVDMHAPGRDFALQPDSPMHPAWRFIRPVPRPAFNVHDTHWHCLGCGRHGGVAEFLDEWEKRDD